MARGKKLSDAYVELRADDSKLTPDVKVKARRIAKEFGGQLNRQLDALKIDPIDVKADPKSAIAAIETTRERLRAMSRDADTVELRVKSERALSQLDRFRKQLGEVDDKPVEPKVDPSPAERQIEQLRRQLDRLGIDPPIDLDADPKAALAEIKRVDGELRRLSREAATVRVRVDADSTRDAVARLRKQIGDDGGEDAARSFAGRFAARLGPLIAEGPGIAVAGTAIGLAMAPTMAAALAAGVVGGAGAGGVVGGVVLAAHDQRVQQAGKQLGEFIVGDLEDRASGFVPVVLGGIARIRTAWSGLGPDLDRIFASSRFVDPLVDGAVSGGRKLIAGLADAVDNADPIIASFGYGLDRIGDAAGDSFTLLSNDADEAASAIDDLTRSVESLIRVTAAIAHAGAAVKGWTDQLDIAIDKGRYWIEDNSELAKKLDGLGVKLDLTADGFAAGSKEAEAYRKATLGTAEAADFAVLKAAGMTDAQIASADASGNFRKQLDKQADSLGLNAEAAADVETEIARMKGSLEQTGVLLQSLGAIGRDQMDGLLVSTGAVSAAMIYQKNQVDLLRQAHEQMYGAVINQTEANEAYQASFDNLTATVETNRDEIDSNRDSLDIHTKAGRSNRDALEELLTKSNEMYYADIAAGVAIDEARRKHEARTARIREEAGQLKLNKTETQRLIETYGKIPPKKTTDLLVEGIDRIAAILSDLYVYQRALATGKTVRQVQVEVYGGLEVDPHLLKREGGSIDGQGLKGVDSVPILAAPGEFMQPVPAVDYYGVAAMQAIRHRQIPREVLQGYASGGLLDMIKGRDWGSSLRYETDVSGMRLPSREQVARAVMPAFGDWPSSPAAQRGDSGIWRRILALVKGSGIPYTFGNAYRPGDPLWHGSGRAVDFMGYNQDRLARFFLARQSQVLELIHRTNTGDYAISRGRRVEMPTQLPLHRNHLHVAMDEGGYLMPGWNPPIWNGTGRPEPVTTARSMDDIADLLRVLIRRQEDTVAAVERIAPGVGAAINGVGQTLRVRGRTGAWPR